MSHSFDCPVGSTMVTVIVTDAILAEADRLGCDHAVIETAAKQAIDEGRADGVVLSRNFRLTDIPEKPQHKALPYLRMLWLPLQTV